MDMSFEDLFSKYYLSGDEPHEQANLFSSGRDKQYLRLKRREKAGTVFLADEQPEDFLFSSKIYVSAMQTFNFKAIPGLLKE